MKREATLGKLCQSITFKNVESAYSDPVFMQALCKEKISLPMVDTKKNRVVWVNFRMKPRCLECTEDKGDGKCALTGHPLIMNLLVSFEDNDSHVLEDICCQVAARVRGFVYPYPDHGPDPEKIHDVIEVEGFTVRRNEVEIPLFYFQSWNTIDFDSDGDLDVHIKLVLFRKSKPNSICTFLTVGDNVKEQMKLSSQAAFKKWFKDQPSDFKIVSSDGQVISTWRVFFLTRTRHFDFLKKTGIYKNGRPWFPYGTLEIDATYATAKFLVDWIEDGVIGDINFQEKPGSNSEEGAEILDLMHFAHCWEISDLKEYLDSQIFKKVTEYNAKQILNQAEEYEYPNTTTFAKTFIKTFQKTIERVEQGLSNELM